MAKTTREVADDLGMKTRQVTVYARKYGLLPKESFGGQPMWTNYDIDSIILHKHEMDEGKRCPACGLHKANDAPAEILATDERDAGVPGA